MRPSNVLALATLALAALWLSACASVPRPEAKPFAGRTVVVTGASSGFGRGTAVAFAARGANVVLAARRTELLEEVAAEARAAGGRALVVTTDVGREADVARLAEAAVTEFGAVDVWVNNAGVMSMGRFDEVPLEDHARVIDVNLKGAIYGSWQAMRRFRAQGRGVLINIGSVESRVPLPYHASYVASKHGLLGLGASIRQELRANGERDIHVVTVMPWAADTPIWDHVGNYTGRRPRSILLDEPEEIVDAVLHAALHPRPEVAVGWKAKAAVLGHRLAPRLAEAAAGAVEHSVQIERAPAGAPPTSGAVHRPMPEGRGVSGGFPERWRAEDAARRTQGRQEQAEPAEVAPAP